MRYYCGKTYLHSEGLSCVFRQWRAASHCRYLHGYALQVEFEFTCNELDENGWVVDFGSLKHVRDWLHLTFDHKTVVALDDPKAEEFNDLEDQGLIQLIYMPHVGCEAFAKYIFDHVRTQTNGLVSVTVREHAGNWAKYMDDE